MGVRPLAFLAAVALAALAVWLRRRFATVRADRRPGGSDGVAGDGGLRRPAGGGRRWCGTRRRRRRTCTTRSRTLGILFARLLHGAADAVGSGVVSAGASILGWCWWRGLMLACLVMGSLAALLRGGLGYAGAAVDDALASLVADLTQLSSRRTWALSWLAVNESIRRRVVVVFVVFVVLILFAGWFIDPSNPDPAKLYIDVVLTSTIYLALFLALFLSALSLPADIKDRTLHTVVTKPVRTSEIVLGRMVGFTLVGTVLLAGHGGDQLRFRGPGRVAHPRTDGRRLAPGRRSRLPAKRRC